MELKKTLFGSIGETEIDLFTLTNDKGVSVSITNFGATITSIKVPDKNGQIEEICCGFDALKGYFTAEYLNNAPYFGGTIGRYCSQIKNAKFKLNGRVYNLSKNVGENNLHGGNIGFDKRIWEVATPEDALDSSLKMQLFSADMEEGFPGNLRVSVTFTLNNDNELIIRYEASTDADTPFAITNHTYFNLSGFKNTVEQHRVMIDSAKKQLWDASGAATGENIELHGGADDLRAPKIIGEVQEKLGDGFEHYFLFDAKGFELAKVAEICDPQSSRTLEIFTTEPGMLFYTGKYTSDELSRESGQKYGKYRGFCCETHRYPNGPNLADAPRSILKKEELFESSTIFKFRW